MKFSIKSIVLTLLSLLLYSNSFADKKVENFLFVGGMDLKDVKVNQLNEADGIQKVYNWKSLENAKDIYSLEVIEQDLNFLTLKGKKLWVQVQDRFFDQDAKNIPLYLQTEKDYNGGLAPQGDVRGEGKTGSGWVAKQWNPNVRARFQKLLAEIAKKFDGNIYGVNLPESAADIDIKNESKIGFSCDGYFQGTVENINFLRNVFKVSKVVQYVNFWPCEWENDRKYMSRFFENAIQNKIGLGGPDIVPFKKGQMKNAYPFFNRYKDQLSTVAFAVQESTRTYVNPKTGKKFTDHEFEEFGAGYLGAKIIFWSVP